MKFLLVVLLFIVLESTTGDYDYKTNPITNKNDISEEIQSKAELEISLNQSIGKWLFL